MSKHAWNVYAAWVLFTEAVGALAGWLTRSGIQLYTQTVTQPPLAPPPIVFPIVWAILYALMGIAAYLVYAPDADGDKKREALKYYAAQLAVNFLWSIVFFRFQAFWAAVAVIVVLDLLIVATMLKMRRVRKAAVYLMVPYLIWTLFATYLAAGVAVLN